MKRKIIKQGNGTLTITLPKQWTKETGLTGNNEIEVEESGHNLIIMPELKKGKSSLNLNIKDISIKNSRTYISNAYKLGYDEIHVTFSHPSDLVTIQKTVDKLLGFEIVSNTKGSCIIKSIAVINKDEFHSIFKKSYQLNLVSFDMLKEDILAGKYPHLSTIEQYNTKILSFTDYCRRLINKFGVYDGKVDKSIYVLLLKLNYINTVIRDIYRFLAAKKLKLDRKIYNFLVEAEKMYKFAFEGYFKEDIIEMDESVSLKKELYDNLGNKLLEKSKGKEAVIISKIQEIIKYIYSATGPIATILINKHLYEKNFMP